jgi:DNA-binding MarR family transcriptional regulator
VQATSPAAPPASPTDAACALYAASFTLNQRITRDLFQLLGELGLSLTQCKMLGLLARQPDDELSVKALGEHVGFSLATASRAVDCLHQRDYVDRTEDVADRRVKRVRITDAGRAAIAELHERNIAALTEFMADLTAEQRRDLDAALQPLLAQLAVRPTPQGPVA